MTRYEELKITYQRLRAAGYIPASPSPADRMDWAYGTTVIENPAITRAPVYQELETKRTT